ncbi:hypothetical protein [Ascidiimonas sp. W6]|uniref:hypothetical protein n=1 Tax=Ascidiimonas meishanensis TaxID=3128903 RepID=UPI0030EB5E94
MSIKSFKWSKTIPWFLTIACTLTLIVIGVFLIKNIEWYKTSVFDAQIAEANAPEYRFYAYHLHLSMIKRSVGLFTGFAVIFLGLGVAFYTLKDATNLEATGGGLSTKIATASPGLIALIVGTYLVISTINSKDYFPPYHQQDATNAEKVLDTTNLPELPFK